jgi:predicted MPP superfamily phosphohydrolase
LHTSFDYVAVVAVLLIQLHLNHHIVVAAKRRLAARQVTLLLWGLGIFSAVMAGAFALGFSSLVSRYHLPPVPSQIIGAVGQIWYFTSCVAWVLYCVFRSLTGHRRRKDFSPTRRRLLNATGTALAAAPFAAVGYGAFIERLNFRVREVEIPVPDLPAALEGLRLVQLSDIHLSAFLSEKDLARVIDSANDLRAHLAFVTGDLISAAGDPLDACLRQIARLRSDAGILGCMGNHEEHARAMRYTEQQGARLGIPFLRHRAHQLNFGDAVMNVAGVDYQKLADRATYLTGAENLIVPGAYNVLLSHNPDVFPVAARKGYDLTVSGHTHGGQVTVEILNQSINAARFFTPYVYGLYRDGKAASYVTRGIGTIGVPARIGAPPEIALLKLRKA